MDKRLARTMKPFILSMRLLPGLSAILAKKERRSTGCSRRRENCFPNCG